MEDSVNGHIYSAYAIAIHPQTMSQWSTCWQAAHQTCHRGRAISAAFPMLVIQRNPAHFDTPNTSYRHDFWGTTADSEWLSTQDHP